MPDATSDLDGYILLHGLDENIAARLRRLTVSELANVTNYDLSETRKPSAMLNMRCNRYEKCRPPPLCEECSPPKEEASHAAPRRNRSDKRKANRANREARLDRLLDSVLTPSADPAVVPSLLDMGQPLRSTGAPSAGRLDWAGMASSCDPFRVGASRLADTACGRRKRESVEAFAWVLEQVILPRVHATREAQIASGSTSSIAKHPTIVDAGCSTGSLLLPLAYAFPSAHFVGIDVKASSLALLNERARAAGLSARVSTWEGRIEEYDGTCDALVSLHACGGASDAALQLAARFAPAGYRAAPFAVSPCCVGALPFGIRSLGGKKEGSGARGAASEWLGAHLERAAAAEGPTAGGALAGGAESGGGARAASEMFALLAASAGADGSAQQQQGPQQHEGHKAAGREDEVTTRQRRSKRVVEIDRLAAMPGSGLGGVMLRISGEATAATSSLTDVLVGPPGAMQAIACA